MTLPTKETQKKSKTYGKTIDLQGVASFAALVELLAHELGTASVKIHGNIRTGAAFNQLVGEVDINNQGFQRKIILFGHPGSPLTVRFKTVWNEGSKIEERRSLIELSRKKKRHCCRLFLKCFC